ncbi:hypothetical protein M422DRAFT_24846 [Sphaerobolus stellatus SS14]|nr:hypothetical protein M422DRAFT_24846 [Sphaerobolus stellatus SS14]
MLLSSTFFKLPLFLLARTSVMAYSKPLTSRANIPAEGFFNPLDNGGRMLTEGFTTFPEGLGEPLNAIISAKSNPDVLVQQAVNGGLLNYFQSMNFSGECLGQHLGDHQEANLGDGDGARNETAVIRYNYGDPSLGSCKESVEGGNHFRYWVQDGSQADSGAIFMAVSYEKPIAEGHDIIFDGYNLARDWLVGNLTGSAIDTSTLTNTTKFTGKTISEGYTYTSTIEYRSGLLQNTSNGINHFGSVGGGPNNITAIDGLVAVITVEISGRPQTKQTSSSFGWTLSPSLTWTLLTLFLSSLGLTFL